jgi:hypothetical protein
MLRLDPILMPNLGLDNTLHNQLNALALANLFSVAVSGATSKVMFSLIVPPSGSSILVFHRHLVTIRLTRDRHRSILQLLAHHNMIF